jgi:predicted HTH transcriptional regulator
MASEEQQGELRQRDLRQLQPLVGYPRETLEIELKGWLDLSNAEHVGSLVKAILALANHGGGYVLIGFLEQGGTWVPDEANRPPDLSDYDQDKINGFVVDSGTRL